MKRCPECTRPYADESLNFCLDDGSRLVWTSSEDFPTAVLSSGNTASHQDIRFCTTADNIRIAYSALGSGPMLVLVLGHFTHLEKEWEWPDLRLFWERLAERFTVVRYDGRGIGLSDKYSGEVTEETRLLALDSRPHR